MRVGQSEKKSVCESRDLTMAIAKWWHMDCGAREPIVQVLAKPSLAYCFFKVAVGSSYEPYVRSFGFGFCVSEWAVCSELSEVEEQLLRVHREVEYLV